MGRGGGGGRRRRDWSHGVIVAHGDNCFFCCTYRLPGILVGASSEEWGWGIGSEGNEERIKYTNTCSMMPQSVVVTRNRRGVVHIPDQVPGTEL